MKAPFSVGEVEAHVLRMFLRLLWLVVVVAVARLVRGRLRPSWNFLTEVALELMRRTAHGFGDRGLDGARAISTSVLRVPRETPGGDWKRVDVGGLPGVWFFPRQRDAEPVILYLHGGGYVMCSVETHRGLITDVCRHTGCRVLAVDYRLAPEHPFPAGLDDAVGAYQWLLAQGVDPSRLFVAGDSAGGGLTLALLMTLRDRGLPLPRAAMCISPWTDLTGSGASIVANARTDYLPGPLLSQVATGYAGEAGVMHPLVSPLMGKLEGLPPLLLQAGGAEMILDDSLRLAEKATAAGVDVTLQVSPDMFHVWHGFASVTPQARTSLEQMGEYVRQSLSAQRAP